MIFEIFAVLYILAAFSWAVRDLNDRINDYGIRWWMVFLFFGMFIFMPFLASIEKFGGETDWLYIVRSWIKPIIR